MMNGSDPDRYAVSIDLETIPSRAPEVVQPRDEKSDFERWRRSHPEWPHNSSYGYDD